MWSPSRSGTSAGDLHVTRCPDVLHELRTADIGVSGDAGRMMAGTEAADLVLYLVFARVRPLGG